MHRWHPFRKLHFDLTTMPFALENLQIEVCMDSGEESCCAWIIGLPDPLAVSYHE